MTTIRMIAPITSHFFGFPLDAGASCEAGSAGFTCSATSADMPSILPDEVRSRQCDRSDAGIARSFGGCYIRIHGNFVNLNTLKPEFRRRPSWFFRFVRL
jgi:hypothetical protein